MEPTTGLRLGAMELPAPLWACLTDLLCASSYLGPLLFTGYLQQSPLPQLPGDPSNSRVSGFMTAPSSLLSYSPVAASVFPHEECWMQVAVRLSSQTAPGRRHGFQRGHSWVPCRVPWRRHGHVF